MNSKERTSKRTAAVTLGLGIAIGAAAMAFVLQDGMIRTAHADPVATLTPIAGVSRESLETIRSLDDTFANLAEYAEASVVHIRATGRSGATDVFGRRMGAVGGEGSGVIYRSDGYIMTNDHVVGGFDKVVVTLRDGQEFEGQVLRAMDSDLALVKIDKKDLPAAVFGDSSKVRPGQFAIAVGSPFGFENTVTVGHISALGRTNAVSDPREGRTRYYPDLIQTDASINVGNSGGPLLNIEGQVIGINTAIFSSTGGNVGIGFAIPSNQARLIADLLIEKGKIERGALGVQPENLKPYQKQQMNIEYGALVMDAPADKPAAQAGIRKDDVIVRIGDQIVRSQIDLRNSMLRYGPGTKVEVEYIRNGKRHTTTVTLTKPEEVEPRRQPQVIPQETPGDPFEEFGREFRRDFHRFFEDEVAPEGPARLGVNAETMSETLRRQFKIPANQVGAVVTAIEPNSAAQMLGLKPGDVIVQLGEHAIKSPEDLQRAVRGFKRGDRTRIEYLRYSEGAEYREQTTLRFP
jgi:serine protease Do